MSRITEDLFRALWAAQIDEDLSVLTAGLDGWEQLARREPKKAGAIDALAAVVTHSLEAAVKRLWREKGLTGPTAGLTPSQLRALLFPENHQWATFSAMEPFAGHVCIFAGGERLRTDLTMADDGDHTDTVVPSICLEALEYCAGAYLLYAARHQLGDWECRVVRKMSATGKLEQVSIRLPFLPADLPEGYQALLKLPRYELPTGNRSVIAKDLLENLQEFIFDPVLPFTLVDRAARYQFDRFTRKISLGQSFKLRRYAKQYLEIAFDLNLKIDHKTQISASVYLFKKALKGVHEQTTRHRLKATFFRNGMHVLFIRKGVVNLQLGANFIVVNLGMPVIAPYLMVVLHSGLATDVDVILEGLAARLRVEKKLLRYEKAYGEELTGG